MFKRSIVIFVIVACYILGIISGRFYEYQKHKFFQRTVLDLDLLGYLSATLIQLKKGDYDNVLRNTEYHVKALSKIIMKRKILLNDNDIKRYNKIMLKLNEEHVIGEAVGSVGSPQNKE